MFEKVIVTLNKNISKNILFQKVINPVLTLLLILITYDFREFYLNHVFEY